MQCTPKLIKSRGTNRRGSFVTNSRKIRDLGIDRVYVKNASVIRSAQVEWRRRWYLWVWVLGNLGEVGLSTRGRWWYLVGIEALWFSSSAFEYSGCADGAGVSEYSGELVVVSIKLESSGGTKWT